MHLAVRGLTTWLVRMRVVVGGAEKVGQLWKLVSDKKSREEE